MRSRTVVKETAAGIEACSEGSACAAWAKHRGDYVFAVDPRTGEPVSVALILCSEMSAALRSVVIDMIKAQGLAFEERTFTVEEAYQAREAFLSSATTFALPVTAIDGRPVGDGKPGPITRRLREAYLASVTAAPAGAAAGGQG